MEAKVYLQKLAKIDLQIVNKTIEINNLIDRLKSAASGKTAINYGERVQSSGSKDKMADNVSEYTDLERELEQYINEKLAEKNAILKDIEMLPVAEYELLHKIYVQGFTLKQVSIQKCCSYSAITSLHKVAKKRLQEILDEREMGDAR